MWRLKCLLCDQENAHLVEMQEHIMDEHGITQHELINAIKEQVGENSYVWKSPQSGQYFMAADPLLDEESMDEPDIDDSVPEWTDYYSNWSDYLFHEAPEHLG